MTAYYNEHDPFAAEWLRILITMGHIAFGDVDDRSIEDVTPSDIAGYTQCHFFAGIGGWSYALRLSGWSDARPVWTLSCPCQPFSAAGKGNGFADERHLWPAAHWLIAQRRPVTIFGEQVASPAGLNWFDTVSADLERTAYSSGAVDLCAAGIGAPHIRQRLYFRADSAYSDRGSGEHGAETGVGQNGERGRRLTGDSSIDNRGVGHAAERRFSVCGSPQRGAGLDAFAEPVISRCDGVATRLEGFSGNVSNRGKPGWLGTDETRSVAETGATRGWWGDCDWWYGKDEKYRPIESGLFPLAHRVPARVGRLRGYGNAIVPELAAEFIQASEEMGELG